MTTTKKSPTLFDLLFWTITRFILWILLGCLGCIIFAVLNVIIKDEASGFSQLQTIVQADYAYLVNHASSHVMYLLNHWLQQMPETSSMVLVNAAFIGIQLMIMRACLLIEWSPLFLLLGLVGLIDGLAQRYIRRTRVERESALIYHQAKALMMVSILLGSFAILVIPTTAITTEWIMAAAVSVFALSIQITAKQFKKYL